jgi:hypothetical protein
MKRYRVGPVITRLCKGGAREKSFHTVRFANGDRFEADLISGPTDGSEGSIEPDVERMDTGIRRIRI